MVSKATIFLGLSMAIVLLITSEVAATDPVETNTEVATKTNGVTDAKYGGSYGGNPGGGYGGGNHGRGGYGGNPGGGYGGGNHGGGGNGRGYCRYGCCQRGYGRDCRRCCSYAGESMDVENEAKPHN